MIVFSSRAGTVAKIMWGGSVESDTRRTWIHELLSKYSGDFTAIVSFVVNLGIGI